MVGKVRAATAAVGLVFSLIVGSTSAQEKRAYKIGSVFSITGAGALLGERMKSTVEMMVEQINTKGGINGHPVRLIVYDAASDVTKAVAATKDRLSDTL